MADRRPPPDHDSAAAQLLNLWVFASFVPFGPFATGFSACCGCRAPLAGLAAGLAWATGAAPLAVTSTSTGPMRATEFSWTGLISPCSVARRSSWSSQLTSTKSTVLPSFMATKESCSSGSGSTAAFFLLFFLAFGIMFSSTGLLRTSTRSMKTWAAYRSSGGPHSTGTSTTRASPTATVSGRGGSFWPSPTSCVSQSRPQEAPWRPASSSSRSSRNAMGCLVSFEGLFRQFLT
mmetsp:Transcript_47774/g.136471  ORF Transcript_47774/g.136471 Transcript_47774/m.136471 type:complete len:234 (-) Transcript_47774:671-1372(-)